MQIQEVESVLHWLGASAVAVVFLLLIWDPIHRKISEWRIKRAFRRRDKLDR